MIFKSNNRKNGFFKAACLGLALLTTAPAMANVTRVSELVDVDPNVWAYKALKELVEKYDVLEGYPDNTFRGNKPATRYELAQALYEVLKVVDLGKMDPSDVDTVGKLSNEYDKELAAIRNRVAALEGRVSALENSASAGGSWTDRIRLSGDLTNVVQTDWDFSGAGNGTQWGTRARLGVDAELIDGLSHEHLGEGIAHIRFNAGNGGPGTYAYHTGGNNLNDVLFDGSNPGNYGSNNSLFSGRTQDSRMDAYLDQAYYSQVFKFGHTDPCSNETTSYDRFFAVADLGQQDLWNTFHKSLVREDSLDGFINQRILHGMPGSSDGITEALHIGLNWLGDGVESEKVDECGNVSAAGVDDCGNPLPGFFQALSLDYAFSANKNPVGSGYDPAIFALLGLPGNNTSNVDPFGAGYGVSATTSRVDRSHAHNVALNFLYDIPGQFFNTGLLSAGYSANFIDFESVALGIDASASDTSFGQSFWAKWEQYFGKNRTFGLFADYAWFSKDTANVYVAGPAKWMATGGVILNTTFFPETWNFNKDQLGLAYSIMDPRTEYTAANPTIGGINAPGLPSVSPTSSHGFVPSLYGIFGGNDASKPEHIIEAYYRKYITENISITPDLQFQVNPNGNDDAALSGIIRATFKLPNWNDGGAFDQFGYRDWSQRIAKYRAYHSKQ
ncbi:MAG: carbohydrate porin [Candidatus Caenarcaniphilales bacterium]|nr:carbohydrate porin [Candidatus Caenarcaniphilales bacterium]